MNTNDLLHWVVKASVHPMYGLQPNCGVWVYSLAHVSVHVHAAPLLHLGQTVWPKCKSFLPLYPSFMGSEPSLGPEGAYNVLQPIISYCSWDPGKSVCAFLEGGPCGFRWSPEERNKTQDSHSWLMISPRELLPVAAWCTRRAELDAWFFFNPQLNLQNCRKEEYPF